MQQSSSLAGMLFAPLYRWREHLLRFRDRWVADPRFQRAALRFGPSRSVARRYVRELFGLTAGFVYSQVLQACIELDLLSAVRAQPRTLAELARHCDLAPDRMQVLARAACSLGLLRETADARASEGSACYALGRLGAALLGNPGVIAMVRHHALLYADLADPVARLRRPDRTPDGRIAALWSYTGGEGVTLDESAVDPYSSLMAASQPMIVGEILAAYPFARHRRLLDVGGGAAAFAIEVARAVPALELQVFDLPAVGAVARRAIGQAGLTERITVHGGDFLQGPLPPGADLVTLVRIAHDHDDEPVARLLAHVFDALEPGGTLLIAEPMSEAGVAAPVADAYFGFYLLAMGSGRPRRSAELLAMMRAAGFVDARRRNTAVPDLVGIVTARKP